MLDDTTSHGLWEQTAPAAPETRELGEHLRFDVVVVGAGFTGLSAALHLALGGARVAVLEAAEIGFGGSGRNVGLVNAGMWVMPEDLSATLGPVHGERLLELLGDAPRLVFELIERYAIACEPERAGTLHLGVGASGAGELAERARQWRKRGAPVELLDAGETARKVGSSRYSASLLDRRAGTIQPLAYVRGLAQAAMAAGATLHTSTPVTACTRSDGQWRAETPRGSITAGWIVVATNAYTTAPWPQLREEIVRLPYFNLATKPLPAEIARSILPELQGCWDTREVLSSFRFDRAGRLVFGSVGALRGSGKAIHRRWAKGSLPRIFPQLAGVAFEHEWYGWIGMTADSLPRFHRLDERVISFSGYNGRGIAPGTVFGRILADHVLGHLGEEELPLPVSAPGAQRFRALREAYYELGSQIAHLSPRF